MITRKNAKAGSVNSILSGNRTSSYIMTFQEYLEFNSMHLQPPCKEFILLVKKTNQFKTEVEITPVNKAGEPFRAYVSGCEIYPVEPIDKLDNLLIKIASERKIK
jgi:hypothetical protein